MRDQNEIVSRERAFWDAIKDGDAERASAMIAEPAGLVTGSQGAAPITREAFKKMMDSPNWEVLRYDFADIKVQFPSDDVAVIAYKVHEDLLVDGKPVSLDAADASVWIRRDGEWLNALHTESLLGDPFGRDKVKSLPDPSGIMPGETFDRVH